MTDLLTFEQVSLTNRERAERWHPGYPADEGWSIADWSNAMAGEAGEACNIVKKIRRWQCGLKGELDPPLDKLNHKLAEELADVFLYLDLLATKANIDLPAAIVAKFNKVSERQGFPERL
jgi:NTP pyrophosphatase (non-canonical NTP hydrolase)